MRFSLSFFLVVTTSLSLTFCQSKQPETSKATTPPLATQSTAHAQSPVVTFIELGSVNCIPCKMMQPVMDSIKVRYPKRVEVIFHDVWTESGKPFGKQYGINAIPTQIFLDASGKEFFRHTGFFPLDEVEKILKTKGL